MKRKIIGALLFASPLLIAFVLFAIIDQRAFWALLIGLIMYAIFVPLMVYGSKLMGIWDE